MTRAHLDALRRAVEVFDAYAGDLDRFASVLADNRTRRAARGCLVDPDGGAADISSLASSVRRAARQAEARLADADVDAAITVLFGQRRGLTRSASDIIARDCPLIEGPGRALKPATDVIDAAFARDADGNFVMAVIKTVSQKLEAGPNPWAE